MEVVQKVLMRLAKKKFDPKNLVRKEKAKTIRFQSSEPKTSRKVVKQHMYLSMF